MQIYDDLCSKLNFIMCLTQFAQSPIKQFLFVNLPTLVGLSFSSTIETGCAIYPSVLSKSTSS